MSKNIMVHDEEILQAMKDFLKTGKYYPLKVGVENAVVGALSFLVGWYPTDEEYRKVQVDDDGKLVLTS